MIMAQDKAPKLAAKGAETRYLVPFAFELSMDYHDHVQTPASQTMACMLSYLLAFYLAMDTSPFDQGLAAASCRKFCLLYAALNKEAKDDRFWRIKPQMHLFQELAEFQTESLGNPRHFWAYKDESFMGFLAQIAANRGGGHTAQTTPLKTMNKYLALCHDGLD